MNVPGGAVRLPRRPIALIALGAASVLAALALALAPAAHAQEPAGGFSGEAPPPGGIGLLVTSDAATATSLSAALTDAGCAPVSLGVTEGGAWTMYITGAPPFVNAEFPAVLPQGSPFFVRCAGTAPQAQFPLTFAESPGSGVAPTQVDMRIAQHEGFDRVVLEFDGDVLPDYRIEYITPPAFTCGAGDPVTPAGNAVLQIRMPQAYVYDPDLGVLTIPSREVTANLPTVVEAEEICGFEATAIWVIGTSSQQPFRLFELSNPARLVIDLRHP